MKITLEEITIKNLLSYGNIPTTLNLKDNAITTITGSNGVGKSTLLVDAIPIALFGKPFRKVKIKTIVNDINRKDCVVDLKFTINKTQCRIVRGFSPDFIELYKGDVKYDSRSSKRHMQTEINDLIQLTPETLKNICILSVNNSTPFLDMTPQEVRAVIENLFGIYVYTAMLNIVKEDRAELLNKQASLDKDISFYEKVIRDYKDSVDRIKLLKENFEKEKETKLVKYEAEKKKKQDELQSATIKFDSFSAVKDKIKMFETAKEEMQTELLKFESQLNELQRQIKEETSRKETLTNIGGECSVCGSILTKEHVTIELNKAINNAQNFKLLKDETSTKYKDKLSNFDALKNDIITLKKEQEKQDEVKALILNLESDIKQIENSIEFVKQDNINKHVSKVLDVEKVKEYIVKFKELKAEKVKEVDELLYCDTIKDILSDKGVKSLVISRELPFLNTKINEYLRIMGFNINLEFNETFDLIISNPRKANFQYNNFSNGQKKRIDLAILLSFIDLAKRKNSINTNLLVFDEILDSSLDADGIGDFLQILNKKVKEEHMNIFIISHKKDMVIENSSRMDVSLAGEFSTIKHI